MKIGSAIVLALSLAACGGGSAEATSTGRTQSTASAGASSAATSTSGTGTGAGAGTGTGTGTGGSTSGFAPAPHRTIPPLESWGGQSLPGPQLVWITAANDPNAGPLQAFGDALVQSQWAKTVLAPYGIAPPASVVHVTNQPALTTTAFGDSDLKSTIAAAITAGAPAPNGHNLYVLFLPEVVGLSGPFVGYHEAYPERGTTLGDSCAVIAYQGSFGPLSAVDFETLTASHEVIEAMTDPSNDGLLLGPASDQPWTETVWASLQSNIIETGDLCEGTVDIEADSDGGTWAYQRIYDNFVAQDGGDNPCGPQATPMYSVSTPQDWYAAAPGAVVQIPFTGWSSAPIADWLIFADDHLNSPNLDAGMGTPLVSTDAGFGTESQCNPYNAMNNGVAGQLAIQVPEDAQPGDWSVFDIGSFVEGGGQDDCYTPRTDDQYHRWVVGVYVPVPDAGTDAPLPASPLSCEGQAAVFGPDGDLYQLCGYQDAAGNLGQTVRYTPATQSWSAAPGAPAGALANFAAALGPDGRIYRVGGWDGFDRYADLLAFDTTAQSWSKLAPMGTARDDLAAVLGSDGKLYAIGGWNGTQALNTVEAYDFDAGTWSTVASLPTAERGAEAALGSDGAIYVFGGQTVTTSSSGTIYTTLQTVQSYDPSSGSWSTSAPALPVPRVWGAASPDGMGHLVLLGGFQDVGDGEVVAETEVFTPGSGWTTPAAPMPFAREQDAAALGPDGLIYVVGGHFLNGPDTGELNTYSPSCQCWTH